VVPVMLALGDEGRSILIATAAHAGARHAIPVCAKLCEYAAGGVAESPRHGDDEALQILEASNSLDVH